MSILNSGMAGQSLCVVDIAGDRLQQKPQRQTKHKSKSKCCCSSVMHSNLLAQSMTPTFGIWCWKFSCYTKRSTLLVIKHLEPVVFSGSDSRFWHVLWCLWLWLAHSTGSSPVHLSGWLDGENCYLHSWLPQQKLQLPLCNSAAGKTLPYLRTLINICKLVNSVLQLSVR